MGKLGWVRAGVSTKYWSVAIYTPTPGKTHAERQGSDLPYQSPALHVKPELHHVSVLDNVLLTFDAKLAGFACFRERA